MQRARTGNQVMRNAHNTRSPKDSRRETNHGRTAPYESGMSVHRTLTLYSRNRFGDEEGGIRV